MTQFFDGLILYPCWSLSPNSSSFELKFWIFKTDLGSGAGIPSRLATLEESRNLQISYFFIINEFGLFMKNLLDM